MHSFKLDLVIVSLDRNISNCVDRNDKVQITLCTPCKCRDIISDIYLFSMISLLTFLVKNIGVSTLHFLFCGLQCQIFDGPLSDIYVYM